MTQADRATWTPWTTPDQPNVERPSFLTRQDVSLLSSEVDSSPSRSPGDPLTQYYEHSFATHDAPSSQIVGESSIESSQTDETDFYSFNSSNSAEDFSHLRQVYLKLSKSLLTDLKDMPNASYLRSISPQTITVNLLLGVISISQPRIIKPRKQQGTVELVELFVGDESSAGFGINIWLKSKPDTGKPFDEILRTQSELLRPRDIVLARNVALGSFRGKVYGQSLRRGVTMLDLLYRNVIDPNDRRGAFKAGDLDASGNADAEMGKIRKVRDWMTNFVGTDASTVAAAGRPGVSALPLLPLDTQ